MSVPAAAAPRLLVVLFLGASLGLSGCAGLFASEAHPAASVPGHPRAAYSLYSARAAGTGNGGKGRGRNWCARYATRNVSCAVLNGSHSQVRAEPQRCRWGLDNCPGGRTYLYRAYLTPVYRVGYKSVTELTWSCCPGFSGPDCETGGPAHGGRPVPTPGPPRRQHSFNGHGLGPRPASVLGERVAHVEGELSRLSTSLLSLQSSVAHARAFPHEPPGPGRAGGPADWVSLRGDAGGLPVLQALEREERRPPPDRALQEALAKVDEMRETLREKSESLDQLRGLVLSHGQRIQELADGEAARHGGPDRPPDYAAIVTAVLRERGGGPSRGAVLNGLGEEEAAGSPCGGACGRRIAELERRLEAARLAEEAEGPPPAALEALLAALDSRLSNVERELTDGGGDGPGGADAWRAEAERAARRLDSLEAAAARLAERADGSERDAEAARARAAELSGVATRLHAALADGAEAARRLGADVARLGERVSSVDGRVERAEGEAARVAGEAAARCQETCPRAAPERDGCGGEAACLKLDSISEGLRGLRDGLTEHVSTLWERVAEINGTVRGLGVQLSAVRAPHGGDTLRGAAGEHAGTLLIETLAGLPEGRAPYPHCAAFSAALTRPVAHHETIKFNRVFVNDGGHYDPDSGIFQVPFDGRYLVSVTVSAGRRGAPVDALLALSEEPLLRLVSPAAAAPAEDDDEVGEAHGAVHGGTAGAGGGAGVASVSLVLCLKAGQALYVENGRGAVAHGPQPSSTFSAVLLYEASALA